MGVYASPLIAAVAGQNTILNLNLRRVAVDHSALARDYIVVDVQSTHGQHLTLLSLDDSATGGIGVIAEI